MTTTRDLINDLTRREWALIAAFLATALVLGFTADRWDPYSRPAAPAVAGQVVNDAATADPEIDWDGIANWAAEVCEQETDDVTYENCWVAAVEAESHTTLGVDDYAVDDNGVYYITKEG